MTHLEEFSADLARAANLNFRLAELLEQHGTAAVLGALASACEGAASGPGGVQWERAAKKMRGAVQLFAHVERMGVTLEDACRVAANVELGE